MELEDISQTPKYLPGNDGDFNGDIHSQYEDGINKEFGDSIGVQLEQILQISHISINVIPELHGDETNNRL